MCWDLCCLLVCCAWTRSAEPNMVVLLVYGVSRSLLVVRHPPIFFLEQHKKKKFLFCWNLFFYLKCHIAPPLCILNFICRTRLVYNSITRVNWWRQLSDIGGLDMREMLVMYSFDVIFFSFIFVTSEASVVDNVPMVSYWKTNENRIMSNSDSDVISSQWLNLNVGLYWYIPYVYTTWSVLLLCHDNKKTKKKRKVKKA